MPPKSSNRKSKRAQKKEAKESHQNSSAVFRINSLGGSRACIKYKGFITDKELLGDEIVELDEVLHHDADIVGKHAIPIKGIESYDMLGRIYRSNIVGSYIILEANYPVMYLTVEYTKAIVSGSLLQIYLSIKMDQKEKIEINKSKKYEKYKNLQFSGTWGLTIECDPELKELWREKITEVLKEDALNAFHFDYEENKDKQAMKTDEILEWIDNKVNTDLEWYEDLMKDTPFEFKTLKRARNYFIELAQDPRLHKLLVVAMDCRILNRRNEQKIEDDNYEIPNPENVVNLGDLRKQMMEDDELIMSNSSESSESSENSDDENQAEDTDNETKNKTITKKLNNKS